MIVDKLGTLVATVLLVWFVYLAVRVAYAFGHLGWPFG